MFNTHRPHCFNKIYPSMSTSTSGIIKNPQTLFVSLIVLAVLFIYIATMPATLYWGDGLELTTTAFFLGIPHPTGYPLYTLVGKIFTLIPVGDIAWRMHLFSVVSIIAGSVIFYFLLRLFAIHLFPRGSFPSEIYTGSICSAFVLIFAFSRTVWRLGTIAEVYALYVFFLISIIYCFVLYLLCRKTKHLLILFFLFMLSLLHHIMTLTALPILLLALGHFFFTPQVRYRKSVVLLLLFFIFVMTMLILLYLPIRANSHPPINWGNPSSLKNFLWVISGGEFKQFYFLQFPAGHPLNIHTFLPYIKMRLASIFDWILSEFFDLVSLGPKARVISIFFLFVLALSGILTLFFRQALLVFALLAQVLLSLAVIFLYGIYDIEDYFISILPSLIIFIFAGVVAIQNLCELHIFRRKLNHLNWVFLVIPIIILFNNFSANDRHQDYTARSYATRIFTLLPEDAIIITSGDNDIYPLWYLQLVEGYRPDVLVFGGNFIYSPWYKAFFFNRDLNGRKIHIQQRPISTEESFYNDLSQWVIAPNIGKFPVFTTRTSPFLEMSYRVKPVATVLTPEEWGQTKARFLPPLYLYRILPSK